jgi:hypothetical protein
LQAFLVPRLDRVLRDRAASVGDDRLAEHVGPLLSHHKGFVPNHLRAPQSLHRLGDEQIDHDFEQGVVQAEEGRGGASLRLTFRLLLGAGFHGGAEEDGGLERLVGDVAIPDEP